MLCQKRVLLLAVIFLAGGLIDSVFSQNSTDEYIFPDVNRKFIIVGATPSGQRKLAGQELSPADSMAALALADITLPFNWQMVRMSQCARNLVKNTEGPNILYLSKNEGGFPRTGVSITDLTGKEESYPDLRFVDLVADQKSITDGVLSIYTHELGHVMMGLVLGDALEKLRLDRSPKQHVSMGITDYLTAFNEGWGVHFQRLGFDNTEKYRLAFENKMEPRRSLALAWHSGLDEYQRIYLVKENGYIYGKLNIEPADSTSAEERILAEHTSVAFDRTRIKNAQEMLSCEGVLATLFYKINTDRKLSESYQPANFYTPFLVKPIPADRAPSEILSPVENVMLKNMWVWKNLSDKGIEGNPFIAFLNEWCIQFPADKEEILHVFILVTQGVTVGNSLAAMMERIDYIGQIGNYKYFKSLQLQHAQLVEDYTARVAAEPGQLTANIGPELWIKSDKVKIRRALWMPEPKNSLAVNLNTASLYELEPLMGKEKARQFIQKRRELGFFSSVGQLNNLGFFW